ncbi:MAG: hypothetical protein IT483_15805 [Gammaproteobacteria bacterium]|nr:hypothetical protein [Gammaproteobacteria bacterium]
MAKSNRTVNAAVDQGPSLGEVQSALEELRRQFDQTYALVRGGELALRATDDPDETALHLLEMAQEMLGNVEYLQRIETHVGRAVA